MSAKPLTVGELRRELRNLPADALVTVSVAAWDEHPNRRAFGEGPLIDIVPEHTGPQTGRLISVTLCFDGYDNKDMETE